jgi:hypothetical protein
MNFDTWIRFGGSENIDEMAELFRLKQEMDIRTSSKNVAYVKQILDAEIERFKNEN